MAEFETTEQTENNNQSAAKAVYDKNARQLFKFEGEDDDNRYILTFAVEGLPDEDLFEYDKLTETQITDKGKSSIMTTNPLPASRWFFEEKVQLVDGFDGDELAANWREDFDDDEREAIVRALLDYDLVVKEETKTLGKRKIGQSHENNRITLKAPFSGEETLLNFDFPPKNGEQIGKYKKINARTEFKRGRSGRFAMPAWKELCSLYDELGVKCDANPAVYLKVAAMRERFDVGLQSQAKKSS